MMYFFILFTDFGPEGEGGGGGGGGGGIEDIFVA